jgi:beta-1,2-mannobiose phosphorylase / 1,2-beta-oligomannan phosphorylase
MHFDKCPSNPILKPYPENAWESLCVLNPAVVYREEDGLFYMIYRAAGNDKTHYIYLGLATSKDGVDFHRESNQPLISPDKNGADGGGVEDPRIVKIGDYYYMTYASRVFAPGQYWKSDHENYGFHPEYGPSVLLYNNTETHLAVSKDLRDWKKLGRITNAKDDDRDVVIFPEKINGKFYRTSRPTYRCGEGYPNKNPAIWLTSSTDLLEWDEPLSLLYQGQEDWEGYKVGASCPPLKTKNGWLLLYHGVSSNDKVYRVGAFLLDSQNPCKILAKTRKPLMEPTFPYETEGYYNGCVFPTANIIKDGLIYIYYGAADHYIGLATCRVDELLKDLLKEGSL